jgi:membrane peptidoglycan carboxypeptidase
MRKRDHNIFANAASLLICGVLAGIVVAAAAFPAIAMGGLAAKAGADEFAELPTSLNVPAPPQITYIFASDAKTLVGTFYDENRHDIPLADIPQVMRDAILAAEDQRFYQHNGVDAQGLLRAFVANQQRDDTQGASTLTMQYVRQAITYSATSPRDVISATEQTNGRKIREMRLALGLEKVLTKDQILQNYLNIAAFGRGAYGIYAASQVYFNKEPKDLTLEEAALLAGLPKAPSDYNPATETGRPKALERRAYVLNQMVDLGMISAEQGELARNSEINVTGSRTPRDCVATTINHWGFFCDFFQRWWTDQAAFGKDGAERLSRLKAGGYRITTTLDVGVQDSAKNNVEAQIPTGSSDALMLAAIEPGTGYVRAMAANRTYSLDTSGNPISTDPDKAALGILATYPNTTNPILSGGGDISGYKAGSTFKIFTMLTALERGFPLDFTIVARSPYQSPIYIVGENDLSVCPDRKHWCPVNANPGFMNGPQTMWGGFGRSVNTYFVPLEEKVGADNVIAMAKRLGVKFRNTEDIKYTNPDRAAGFGPFTIGVTDTVPLELANAYATVAADGVYCEPMPVQEILENKGDKVEGVAAPRCGQAVPPEVARAAADAARCPVNDTGGVGKCTGFTTDGTIARTVGQPVIGKTGTSDFNWTANMVLATKHLAIATTVANPDFAQTKHGNEAPTAANRAARDTMAAAVAGKEVIDFARPPNNLISGTKVPIPPVDCKSVAEATAAIKAAGFDVAIDPKKVASPCPPDTVAQTDPTGATSKGSTVSLQLSGGPNSPPNDH